MTERELVIIGGGAAGLSAALSAWNHGCRDILIIERERKTGGVLRQCIHAGFGLHRFKAELTGPEYAARFIDMAADTGIRYMMESTVIDISMPYITVVNEEGISQIKATAIILAMGSRERSRGNLNIPGTRPAGVFSAGTAQAMVNLRGERIGHKAVILGSGDIGLIMARRLTLEGISVSAVAEIMPYSSGLRRNIVQCLDDYGIPLFLSHTVTRIEGRQRVEKVIMQQVDSDKHPIAGTEREYDCDTLLLSVGLVPENELSRKAGIEISPLTNGPAVDDMMMTSVPGIFASGNVLHIHDLADYVSDEAEIAGKAAASYIKNGIRAGRRIPVIPASFIRYAVPQSISSDGDSDIMLRFRGSSVLRNAKITIRTGSGEIKQIKKAVLSPGEMESIRIERSLLEGADFIEIKASENE